jgi:hypothetical protein
MYSELAEAQHYADLVVYAMLACPILLYTQECLDVFRLVASETLVVTVYRDVVRAFFNSSFETPPLTHMHVLAVPFFSGD